MHLPSQACSPACFERVLGGAKISCRSQSKLESQHAARACLPARPPVPRAPSRAALCCGGGALCCAQVVRTALVDSASVSSLITTSECVIAEAPEEKKAGGGGAMPPDMY